MKRILSLLMAFVFLQTQTWALSGGPDYTANSGDPSDVTGTFSGVMIPENNVSNAIAVFTVNIPDTGIGVGTWNYFDQGNIFLGSVTGAADPQNTSFRGYLIATATQNRLIATTSTTGTPPVTTTTFSTQTVTSGTAQGRLDAEIAGLDSFTTIDAVGARIEGQATITITPSPAPVGFDTSNFPTAGTVNLEVSGFRQQTN